METETLPHGMRAFDEADGVVGTFVPLPVEAEMCRKASVQGESCF